ncbi:ATP-binding protein [Actinoplanes sp. N902-109]|uniref:sensor histidine kinase n=1 Tax=Actinoplanes sp. (strain N902-109) TaxID=649831 RepID=UPI0003295AE9|nr:ATP-binding protein [Actinoplanes sp. N902-109]AGL16545.1 two-component hybrid sensor and regulator [Actinoplanes sp. N902-109]
MTAPGGDSSAELDHRALFRGAPAALLVLDPDLTIVDASDAYLTATVRTRTELVGRPVFAAFPDNPDDPAAGGVAMLDASLRRVLRTRTSDVMEIQQYDIPQPGGGFDVRYWAPVNAPVHGPGGQLRWIVHRVEDVTSYVRAQQDGLETAQLSSELQARTERMEAEVFARRQLQRLHGTLQAVVDSLDVAVIGSDADGRTVFYNEAARELVGPDIGGLTPAERAGRLHLYDAHGRPLGRDVPSLRALRGEHVRDAEIVQQVPGRPRRFFRVHSHPITGHPGVAVVAALHDTTAIHRTAQFQQCELAIARVVAAPRPDHEVLADAVRLIGSMIGWDETELWTCAAGADSMHLVSRWTDPAGELPPRWPGSLAKGQGLPGQAWRNGEPIWLVDPPADHAARGAGGPVCTAMAVPLPPSASVPGVLACYSETVAMPGDVRTEMITGIAPQLGAYLVRWRAERLAADLAAAHDQYIALAGHELRTPLTSLQSYTELLLDEPGLTDDQRHMLTVMQRNAASLRAVVLKLLDVAALRAGRFDVRKQPTDLAAILRDATGTATDTGRPIAVQSPGALPLNGDPARLRQVVDELLTNALTWADPGSTVDVRLTGDEHTATLAVANRGPAIPAGERDHLFDLFYRGDEARRRGLPGAGMGLSLAAAVIDRHAGSLTLDPAGDGVTCFTARLPR